MRIRCHPISSDLAYDSKEMMRKFFLRTNLLQSRSGQGTGGLKGSSCHEPVDREGPRPKPCPCLLRQNQMEGL